MAAEGKTFDNIGFAGKTPEMFGVPGGILK